MAIKSLQHSSIRDNVFYRSMLAGNAGFAPSSFDFLESQVLTTTASSVTFTGLGSYTDYEHLQLRLVAKTNNTSSGTTVKITFNGDTGNNYSRHELYAYSGGTVSSFATTSIPAIYSASVDSNGDPGWGLQIIDILDFGSSNKNTTTRTQAIQRLGSYGSETVTLGSGAWYNTSAVTSLTITTWTASFIAGSRFSIYGVK